MLKNLFLYKINQNKKNLYKRKKRKSIFNNNKNQTQIEFQKQESLDKNLDLMIKKVFLYARNLIKIYILIQLINVNHKTEIKGLKLPLQKKIIGQKVCATYAQTIRCMLIVLFQVNILKKEIKRSRIRIKKTENSCSAGAYYAMEK